MGKNDLVNLLEKFCYDNIFSYVKNFIESNPNEIYAIDKLNILPCELEITGLDFINTLNSKVENSLVTSEAIISLSLDYKENYREDFRECEQWLLLSIEFEISDTVENFKCQNIEPYSKKKYDKNVNSVTNSFVPILSKEDLDVEAETILKEYCPQALTEPMAVPIKDIARLMGLRISDKYHFNTSNQIFGAISFFDCKGILYDKDNNKKQIHIPKGSIIIDSNTYYLGNVGCVNFTIAHEVYHWYKHRMYAQIQHLIDKNTDKVLCRCKTQTKYASISMNQKDDIDWMEWQANNVAPKILMPKKMFKRKMIEYFNL